MVNRDIMGAMSIKRVSRLFELRPWMSLLSRFARLIEVTIIGLLVFLVIIGLVVSITQYIKDFIPSLSFNDALTTIIGLFVSVCGFVAGTLIILVLDRRNKNNSITEIRAKEKILYQNVQQHLDYILNKQLTGKEF